MFVNSPNKLTLKPRSPTPPPCSKQTFRVLRHYNNAAGSMAEKVRDEKTQWRRLDSANGTHTNTSQTIATSNSGWGAFPRRLYIFTLAVNDNRAPQTGNEHQTPSSLLAEATSMAALPTITSDRSG